MFVFGRNGVLGRGVCSSNLSSRAGKAVAVVEITARTALGVGEALALSHSQRLSVKQPLEVINSPHVK